MDPTVPLPSLAALRAFEAAARLGSFQAAAEALRLTPPAISHQIKTLEMDVGHPLFIRRHRKVVLTETGQRLQGFVQRGFDELRRGMAALRQERQGSVLRVTAVTAFATAFLAPRLERFEAAHPGLELKLEISNGIVDFDVDPYDIGIRLGPRSDPGLFSEDVLPVIAAPVCVPAIAARLSRFQDFAQVTRITLALEPAAWSDWFRAAAAGEPPPARELVFESLAVGLQATLDGLGVMVAPLHLVTEHLRAGRLVMPFEELLRTGRSWRLVCRRGEEALPKIERFRRWLRVEVESAFPPGASLT